MERLNFFQNLTRLTGNGGSPVGPFCDWRENEKKYFLKYFFWNIFLSTGHGVFKWKFLKLSEQWPGGKRMKFFFVWKEAKYWQNFQFCQKHGSFFKKPAWKLVIITVILSEKRQNAGKISNFARHVEGFKKNRHENWLLLSLFCLIRGKMLAKFPILPEMWKFF